jgi:hypothetical protein
MGPFHPRPSAGKKRTYKWRLIARKNSIEGWIFQQAMFDYRRIIIFPIQYYLHGHFQGLNRPFSDTGGGTFSDLCLSLSGLELRPQGSEHANDCTSGLGFAISGRHEENATLSGYELVLKVGEHGA